MLVVIDTNELYFDPYLTRPKAVTFISNLNKLDMHIVIPSVVFQETTINLEKQLRQALQSSKEASKGLPWPHKEALTCLIDDEYIEQAKQDLSKRLRDVAYIANYPKVSHEEVIARMLNGRRPFQQNSNPTEKGYKDTLIWYTILELLQRWYFHADDEQIAFVSSNHKDFAERSSEGFALHPQLKDDLLQNGFAPSRVQFFQGLNKFLEEFALPRLEQIDELTLEFQRADITDLVNEAFQTLEDDILSFRSHAFGLPDVFDIIFLNRFTFHSWDIKEIIPVKDTDVYLSLEICATFDFTVKVAQEEAEYYARRGRLDIFGLNDDGTNDGECSANAMLRVSILFDKSSRLIHSTSLEEIQPLTGRTVDSVTLGMHGEPDIEAEGIFAALDDDVPNNGFKMEDSLEVFGDSDDLPF